jgi:MFS family permease
VSRPDPPIPPVWRNVAFLRLWIAQAISQTAQNAVWYALLVIVEEVTHSTTALGLTILSVVVPSVLFGVPAGADVDRWDKRWVLVVSSFARFLVCLLYIPLSATLPLLYTASFIFSVISQFFAPAETAIIPALVHRNQLTQASSFFQLTFLASQLLGLVLFGPLLIKLAGITTFFIAIALLYALCGLLCWGLSRGGEHTQAAEGVNPVADLVAQLRAVTALLLADQRMLAAMGYLTMAGTLTLIVAMVAPRFVVQVLGIAAADTVVILAPGGVGALAAAFLLSRTAGARADRQRHVTMGLAVMGIALIAVAGVPWLARLAGMLQPEGQAIEVLSAGHFLVLGGTMLATLLAGAGLTVVIVSSQTVLQELAPEAARGRVFAVQLMLANLFSIVPLLLIGGLADLVGPAPVLLLLGVGVGLAGAVRLRRPRAPTRDSS